MILLPKSLVEIGDEAFSGCTAFRDQIMVVPHEIEKVGRSAFLNTYLDELRTEEPEFVEEETADGN